MDYYDLGRPKPQEDADVEIFRNLAKKYVADLDKTILVAELDDIGIVGMMSIVFLPRLNHSILEMYVPELVVLEKYQNQGIGKKLFNSCIDLAKEKNVIALDWNLEINEKILINSIKI